MSLTAICAELCCQIYYLRAYSSALCQIRALEKAFKKQNNGQSVPKILVLNACMHLIGQNKHSKFTCNYLLTSTTQPKGNRQHTKIHIWTSNVCEFSDFNFRFSLNFSLWFSHWDWWASDPLTMRLCHFFLSDTMSLRGDWLQPKD